MPLYFLGFKNVTLKMLHSQNPLNPKTQISRYKFKQNQNLNLNLNREIPRNLSFSIWQIVVTLYTNWSAYALMCGVYQSYAIWDVWWEHPNSVAFSPQSDVVPHGKLEFVCVWAGMCYSTLNVVLSDM